MVILTLMMGFYNPHKLYCYKHCLLQHSWLHQCMHGSRKFYQRGSNFDNVFLVDEGRENPTLYLSDFSGGGVQTPCSPSGSAYANGQITKPMKTCLFFRCLLPFLCIVAFQNGTPVFCLKLRVREPTVAYFS